MSITPESVQTLLDSQDYGNRIQGINQLRQLPAAQAFPLVVPLVKDDSARVRYAAVSLFDTLGGENPQLALELLRDRLHNDSEVDVQSAAADALAALKFPDAFEDLQQVYQQTSEWLLQFSIVAALGEMGDPRAFDLLKDALARDNHLLQTASIGAFGDLGNTDAVPLIIPFATNTDWQIRLRVAQSLGRLDVNQAKSTLEKLAEDEVEQVAAEAKRFLNN